MAKMATLQDPFTEGSINGSLWGTYIVGASITAAPNGINISLPPASQTNYVADFYSVSAYDLTGSYMLLNVTEVFSATNTYYLAFAGAQSATTANDVYWNYANGTLSAEYNVSSVNTVLVNLTYNSELHAWWRIRESGGTTYWDTSSNGTDWVNQASVADPITMTSLNALLYVGCYAPEANADTWSFLNFNVTPAIIYPQAQTQGPVKARLPKQPRLSGVYMGVGKKDTSFGTGQIQWSAGGPVSNPTKGPVFHPFVQAVRAKVPWHPRRYAGWTAGTVPKVIQLTNDFDGGTSGTTISAGNSGGLSGNAFDSVAVGSGGTAKYSNAVVGGTNLLAGLFQTTTANATAAIWANSMGPQYQIWFRAYLFFATLPTGNSRFFTILNAAGTGCARFYVTTAGAILVQDGAGSTITTSTATIPVNQWFRIEGFASLSPTHGQTSVSLFTPAGSIVVTETDTSALTQNTLGVATSYAFGPDVAAANQGPFYVDGIGISNTGYLGAIPGNWSPGGFQSFDSIVLPSIMTTFPSM